MIKQQYYYMLNKTIIKIEINIQFVLLINKNNNSA